MQQLRGVERKSKKKSKTLFAVVVSLLFLLSFANFSNAAWWNTDYAYKRSCVINSTVSSTLTDFPAYCVVNTAALISAGKMQSNCNDLRIINSGETTQYSHEIEQTTCNTTTTIVWFKHPSLASGNQTVYVYYGNPSATNAQDLEGLWQNYSYVHHHNQILPSKPTSGITMTVGTAVTYNTSSRIGGNSTFHNGANGAGNAFIANTSVTHNASKGIYRTFWAKTTGGATPQTYPAIVQNAAGGAPASNIIRCGTDSGSCTAANNNYWIYQNYDGTSRICPWVSTVPADGSWFVLSATWNPTNSRTWVYKNGVQDNTCADASTFSGNLVWLPRAGASSTTEGFVWNGNIDEYRIGMFNASADWVKAEYAQQYWLGAEQESGTAIITIHSPTNQNYYSTSVLLNFSFIETTYPNNTCWKNMTGAQTNFSSLGVIQNNTYYTENMTGLTGGNYTVKIICQNGGAPPINASTSTPFYVWMGLNTSAFNAGNSTALANWTVTATNGTTTNSTTASANPLLWEWKYMPTGNVNLTFSANYYANRTYSTQINNSAVTQVNAEFWRNQYFYANNSNTGAAIQSFNVAFTNGTKTHSCITSNYECIVSLENLGYGNNNVTVSSSGFNTTKFTQSFDGNSAVNRTFPLAPATLQIWAYDETTPSSNLTFNLTISNATTSQTWMNQTNFSKMWNEIPYGQITIAITEYNGNYITRYYYTVMNENTAVQLNAYLLKTSEGMYVRFNVKDYSDNNIANALVTIQKQYTSAWVAIAQRYTDESGVATHFLNPNNEYRIKVERINYATAYVTVVPSNTDYRIYLSATNATTSYQTIYANLTLYFLPETNVLNISNAENISFVITDPEGLLSIFGLRIWYNYTIVFDQNITTSPNGGTITATINTSNYSGALRVMAESYFKKSGYAQQNLTKWYGITTTTSGLLSLARAFGRLASMTNFNMQPIFAILALVLTVAAAGFVAAQTTIGGGAVAIALLGIFSYLNFLPWIAFVATGMLVGALIFLRGRV